MGGTKGHAPGRELRSCPADKKEIEGLKLQKEALDERIRSWEKKYEHEKKCRLEKNKQYQELKEEYKREKTYGDQKKKECEDLEKKYEREKKYGDKKKKECEDWKKKYEDLRKKLCRTCKKI